MRILIKACDIPEAGAIVTKRTGEKEYRLRTKINIYNGSCIGNYSVDAREGHLLLVDTSTGDATNIKEDQLVLWSPSTMIFIEEVYNSEHRS